MTEPITSFKNQYAFLSNFYPAIIKIKELEFKTVEHAYQYYKVDDPMGAQLIIAAPTPGIAKRLGNKYKRKNDWDSVKESTMLTLLFEKFKIPNLADRLIATRDAELIEGNVWGDKYWGVCFGKGENKLGKLLMYVRSELIS